jgi:hypothetical protein
MEPVVAKRWLSALSALSAARLEALFAFALVAMALLFSSRRALAHTPGISTADFDVQPDARVLARLTFSSAELLASLALDRDHDGIVTEEDVLAAREDLRALVVEGTEVDADGSACAATFRDASLTEVDGLVLQADYACPSDAEIIEVTLYYLNAWPRRDGPPGAAPRAVRPLRPPRLAAVTRLTFGSATTEGVLTAEQRAIALRVPGRADAAARKRSLSSRRSHLLAVAAATVVIALLAYGSQRWRAARTAWQNRMP